MPWPLLTEDLIPEITQWVKEGNWPEIAAKGLGVRPQDWTAWKELGEQLSIALCVPHDPTGATKPADDLTDHERLCVTLVRAVDHAEAECEGIWLKNWLATGAAGRGNGWQAFATMLERRFPERWGKRPPQGTARKRESLEDTLDRISRRENEGDY